MFVLRHSVLLSVLASLVAFSVIAQERKAIVEDRSLDDATFVQRAHSGNAHEFAMNSLAVGRAENKDVQTFAQQMIKDHMDAQTQLTKAAKSAGVAVPDKMSKEHQAHVDHFTKMKKGADFDAAFMKHMVADHEKAVELYESAVKAVKDADLRKYAEKTLPVIREHHKKARRIQESLGGK